MTTAYTSLLGLALPVTGELQGTWGDTVNNSITSLLDAAVAGTTTLSTDADVTLTTTTGAANQARQAVLLCSGARTAIRNITAPAQSKIYTVINSTTGGFSVVIRGAGPTTGVTILAGESAQVAWNGSDFIKISNTAGISTFYTITATAPTTASSNKGAINYGTLGFSDTGIVASYQTSVNSYFQNVIQNTSNGTAASSEFIAYNDQGTATTNFAAMGINSSGYTGTGSINAPGYAYFLSGSTDLVLGTIGSNKIHFTVNSGATDAMLIDTSGNVGVGVTPSAWVSPALPAIDIGTMGAIAGQTSASNLHFVANGYLGSGPAWKYKTTNYSSRFTAGNDSGTGGFSWYTAPSGTAGNAITFTQAMTLDFSGNLLVGTTSGADRLTVNGSAAFKIGSTNVLGIDYQNSSGGYGSATARILGVSKNTVTGRSIGADGTINASGADYAEYMTKASDFTIAKGDVVGINADGKLTNIFVDAISFVVKSTDPSYVGNDKWGVGFEDDKDGLEAARQTVDRIAFAGQVPVNVTGATAGQYIIPVNDNGAIKGEAVSNPTFEQYQQAVGKVIAIEQDGRARIIVKVA